MCGTTTRAAASLSLPQEKRRRQRVAWVATGAISGKRRSVRATRWSGNGSQMGRTGRRRPGCDPFGVRLRPIRDPLAGQRVAPNSSIQLTFSTLRPMRPIGLGRRPRFGPSRPMSPEPPPRVVSSRTSRPRRGDNARPSHHRARLDAGEAPAQPEAPAGPNHHADTGVITRRPARRARAGGPRPDAFSSCQRSMDATTSWFVPARPASQSSHRGRASRGTWSSGRSMRTTPSRILTVRISAAKWIASRSTSGS